MTLGLVCHCKWCMLMSCPRKEELTSFQIIIFALCLSSHEKQFTTSCSFTESSCSLWYLVESILAEMNWTLFLTDLLPRCLVWELSNDWSMVALQKSSLQIYLY